MKPQVAVLSPVSDGFSVGTPPCQMAFVKENCGAVRRVGYASAYTAYVCIHPYYTFNFGANVKRFARESMFGAMSWALARSSAASCPGV